MNKKQETNKQPDIRDNGLNWLLAFIFKTVYPPWKRHEGQIPETVLAQLDEDGDWPAGTAMRAMERLNRDRKLVEQLEEHFASETSLLRRKHDNEPERSTSRHIRPCTHGSG